MRNYLKEGKESYYICKICNRRVLKVDLTLYVGVVYHKKCFKAREDERNKKIHAAYREQNDLYVRMLRKHKGLKEEE